MEYISILISVNEDRHNYKGIEINWPLKQPKRGFKIGVFLTPFSRHQFHAQTQQIAVSIIFWFLISQM